MAQICFIHICSNTLKGEESGSPARKEEKGKMSLDDENVVAGLLDACHILLSEHSELAGVDAEEKEDFYGFVERAIPFLRSYYSVCHHHFLHSCLSCSKGDFVAG